MRSPYPSHLVFLGKRKERRKGHRPNVVHSSVSFLFGKNQPLRNGHWLMNCLLMGMRPSYWWVRSPYLLCNRTRARVYAKCNDKLQLNIRSLLYMVSSVFLQPMSTLFPSIPEYFISALNCVLPTWASASSPWGRASRRKSTFESRSRLTRPRSGSRSPVPVIGGLGVQFNAAL